MFWRERNKITASQKRLNTTFQQNPILKFQKWRRLLQLQKPKSPFSLITLSFPFIKNQNFMRASLIYLKLLGVITWRYFLPPPCPPLSHTEFLLTFQWLDLPLRNCRHCRKRSPAKITRRKMCFDYKIGLSLGKWKPSTLFSFKPII